MDIVEIVATDLQVEQEKTHGKVILWDL